MKTEKMYIIDPVNFPGYVESTINEHGFVDYVTPSTTFEDYKKIKGNDRLVALPWDVVYNDYFAPYHKSLQEPFKEITPDQYDDALSCLPPLKWHNLNERFNVFFCSEFWTADLTSCTILDRKTEKCYQALRSIYVKDDYLINELETLVKDEN
jgi:hypothetical protein